MWAGATDQSKHIARITMPSIELSRRSADELKCFAIGNMCTPQVKLDNGRELLTVIMYILPESGTRVWLRGWFAL